MGREEMALPDHFKTCKAGEPIEVAAEWARSWYPNAEVLIADDEEDQDDEDEEAA